MAEEAEKASKPKPWTEGEKLGVLFQIIESAPIPWDTVKLPEGRTKKAVQVMIDREKTKMKKAKEAEAAEAGEDVAAADNDGAKTPKAKGGKRKTEGEGSPKKPKTPRKKKTAAATAEPEETVKDEPAADDI